MKLKKAELKKVNEVILSEIARLQSGFKDGNDKFHLNGEELSDDVDQANADYDRAQMLRFRNRDIFYFKKLNKALEKIQDGSYGECEDCGCNIRYERLLARPTAELCIGCKDEAEREELNNFVARQSKSLGKQVDLAMSH
jgi:DnaK suppressor protein